MLVMGLAAISAIGLSQRYETTLYETPVPYKYQEGWVYNDCLLKDIQSILNFSEKKTQRYIKIGWASYRGMIHPFKITRFVEGGNKTFMWSLAFQNAKYTHITDVGLIAFRTKEQVEQLTSDLEAIFSAPYSTGITYTRDNYNLVKEENATGIYVYDKDDKYFILLPNLGDCLISQIRETVHLMD